MDECDDCRGPAPPHSDIPSHLRGMKTGPNDRQTAEGTRNRSTTMTFIKEPRKFSFLDSFHVFLFVYA